MIAGKCLNKGAALALFITMFFAACISDENTAPKGPVMPGQTAEKPIDPASLTSIQWIDSVIDKGAVLEGTKPEVIFRFKNTGTKPLVIESAQPSCGCTVPEKPEEPIMPGEEGRIKAVFNSQGRIGSNHKTITVHANTSPGTYVVSFDVTVVGKDDGPKATSQKDAKTF